jgi:hypothetical protein
LADYPQSKGGRISVRRNFLSPLPLDLLYIVQSKIQINTNFSLALSIHLATGFLIQGQSKAGQAMSIEQPKDDELVANQLRLAIQAHGETAVNSASAKVGPPHEIKIDASHRVSNSPTSGGGYTFYVALIVGLLVTTCAVAWFILYESALPFDLPSSGLTGNRDVYPKAISLEHSSNSPADRTPDAQKRDSIQIHDTMVREIARSTPAEAAQNSNVSSASPTTVTTAPVSRLANTDPTIASRRGASIGVTVKEMRTPTKLTPTPETRPTTIEGWTLREVVNGSAVIEGPNGVWKVTPGQTVPGIGRIDSIVRWGNRLVVATSRGLISTP